MSDKTKAILAIVLGSIITGAVSPVTKIGLVKIPPFSFSFIRFFLASVCLLPFITKTKYKLDNNLKTLTLISLLPTINVALFVLGLRTTTASIAQFLYAATPLLAGIGSYFILKNKLPFKKWLSIFIGLLGVSLVIFLPTFAGGSTFAGDLRGNLLISIGVIVWSIYFVLTKKLQKKFTPLHITSMFIFVATFVFLFLMLSFESRLFSQWWYSLKPTSILAVIYVGVFATVLSYLLGQYAVKFANPVVASFSLYLTPIFAYFFSFLLLAEKLTQGLLIGTILVFTSVALTTYTK